MSNVSKFEQRHGKKKTTSQASRWTDDVAHSCLKTLSICLCNHIIAFHFWLSVIHQRLLTHRVWIKLFISKLQVWTVLEARLCGCSSSGGGRQGHISEVSWGVMRHAAPEHTAALFRSFPDSEQQQQQHRHTQYQTFSWRNESCCWTPRRRTSSSKCKNRDRDIQSRDLLNPAGCASLNNVESCGRIQDQIF